MENKEWGQYLEGILAKISFFTAFQNIWFILSVLSWNPDAYGPITTKRKGLLILGDTFGVVESILQAELMTIGIFNGGRMRTI